MKKNILTIFKRDLKVILKSPIPLIITLGVSILPSLYAWVNIAASWDPYSNTGTIPIAVVNNDKGTEFNDKELNVGDEVVDKLKDNDSIGWKFTTSKEAELGVLDSTYYASIEIPEDFSEKLTSLVGDDPEKPTIIYKVDTKENPVANKITTIAQETLVKEIKSSFLTTVNETVFSSLNTITENLGKNKNEIIAFKDLIIKLNKNMDTILNSLQYAGTNSQNLTTYLQDMDNTIPQLTSNLTNLQNNNSSSAELSNITKSTLDNALNNLDTNLQIISSNKDKINSLLKDISNGNDSSEAITKLKEQVDSTADTINAVNKFVTSLNNTSRPNNSLTDLSESLTKLESSLKTLSKNLDDLLNYDKSASDATQDYLNSLNKINNNINDQINSITNNYNNNIKNIISNFSQGYVDKVNKTNEVIDQVKNTSNDLSSILTSVANGSELVTSTADDLRDKLLYFKDSIAFLSDNLEQVSDDDLTQIVSILQSDPNMLANYASDPFDIVDDSIYKVDNYGSGMAPIYSVLAMWVGCLILASIFSTEAKGVEGLENFTAKEKYFGKLLLFAGLSTLQGLIIMLGDKFILGVQTSNTFLFIMLGAIISFVFGIITYTNVALFGDFGKAINIILLVMQLAGAGGAYPIQVAPKIFKILQPFFPFTYALSGVREAIAGPLVSTVTLDLIVLFIFGGIYLLIGTSFKGKFEKYVHKFNEKFEESGIAE